MTTTRSGLPGWVRRPPSDLLAVVFVIALANFAVFHSALSESPIRVVTGLVFVLFIPGYALVAALFPEAGQSPTVSSDTRSRLKYRGQSSVRSLIKGARTIDIWERLALSFACSLAIVPLLALVVTLSPLAFTSSTVFFAISAFTVLCVALAVKRRSNLLPENRFRLSPTDRLHETRRSLAEMDSRGEVIVTIALVVAILFAVGTFGFAVLSPPDGERYTEFYVLSENDENERVAAEYPDAFTPDEPESLVIGIENYEEESVEYDVIVQLQRVENSDEDAAVIERHQVDHFSVALEHNETWIDERELTVSDDLTGSELRLTFLLYDDSPPESPTRENAYRDLHIWIDVPDPDSALTTSGGIETVG